MIDTRTHILIDNIVAAINSTLTENVLSPQDIICALECIKFEYIEELMEED